MELSDFLSWWDVSNQQLADICECSISTVERWFLNPDSPNHREPTEEHKRKLALAHYLWLAEEDPQQRERYLRLQQMYNPRLKKINE